MLNYINYIGKIVEDDKTIINATDHSYRYGDGLFETMKVKRGNILYEEFHFERLFAGLKVLKIKPGNFFAKEKLVNEILSLCKKNNRLELARVRLSVSRGGGGLYDCDDKCSYLIECWQLDERGFNENGLVIDIFPDAKKSIDSFSNLKSANYLPYVMAAIWAKENKLNDALILNSNGRICDATIANIFWVKREKIFTPPLSEGCVAGIVRRKLIELNSQISEAILTEESLLDADEVFLTNVITGIRWVKQFRDKTYSNEIASKLFTTFNQTI
jgi:branched-chain amino acid aminotransferase